MNMYLAGGADLIKKVEITFKNKSGYWYKYRGVKRFLGCFNENYKMFETKDEAKEFLLKKQRVVVKQKETDLANQKKKLKKILEL